MRSNVFPSCPPPRHTLLHRLTHSRNREHARDPYIIMYEVHKPFSPETMGRKSADNHAPRQRSPTMIAPPCSTLFLPLRRRCLPTALYGRYRGLPDDPRRRASRGPQRQHLHPARQSLVFTSCTDIPDLCATSLGNAWPKGGSISGRSSFSSPRTSSAAGAMRPRAVLECLMVPPQ